MKPSSSTIKRASRALALILSLMLLITMTAIPVLAADGTATDPSLFVYSDNGDGTITIEGYIGDDRNTMTELVIPAEIDGAVVTYINDIAFAHCESLEKVTVPKSVTHIGYAAFYDCPNLKSVTIPTSVTSIGYYAFGYYEDEETGNYFNKIDGFTIKGCNGTEAEKYAKDYGVEFIGLFVYEKLSSECVKITGYTGDEAQLDIPEEIDGRRVVGIGSDAFKDCTSLTSVTIPKGVIYIGNSAFKGCANLTSVTIPEGMICIDSSAFEDCISFKAVTIPKSVTSINNYAFGYGDNYQKVNGFKITGYKNSAAYKYAMENGFEFVSLGEVNPFTYYDDGHETVEIIDYNGYETQLDIPAEIDGKTVDIIGYDAFYDCPSLKTVTIPKSVVSIERNAFGYCGGHLNENGDYVYDKVEGFTITGYTYSAAYAYAIDNGFKFVSLGEVGSPCYQQYYDDGKFELYDYYGDKKELVRLDIPAEVDGNIVTAIRDRAFFFDYPNLKAVTIPASVTSIGVLAFGYNNSGQKVDGFKITGYKNSAAYRYAMENGFEFVSLGEVNPFVYDEIDDGTVKITGYNGYEAQLDIPAYIDGKRVTSIGESAFEGYTNLKGVTISEGVTEIENKAFYNCQNLKNATIPKSVVSIGNYALGYYIDAETKRTKKSDGFKITGYKNSAAYVYARDESFEFISVGEASPFAYKVLDNGTLELFAYYGDDKKTMTKLDIPKEIDGKSVTVIGGETFKNYTNITSVTIPEGVTSIGYQAFDNCERLTSLTIPESVTEIGWGAFGYCRSLASVTIPEGVTEIGEYTFFDCASLASVTIPESVTKIGKDTFYGCTSLTSITIPEGMEEIGETAFNHCPNLKSVKIPKSVSSIGSRAFGYYENEETGYYTKIDGFKIAGYKNSAAYVYARDNGFDFTSLGKVDPCACRKLEDGTLEIVAYYSDDIEKIIELDIPAEIDGKSVTKIGQEVFGGCIRIENVIIPKSVTSIGKCAFCGCSSLKSVTIPTNVISIEDKAFGYDYYFTGIRYDYKKVDGFIIKGYTGTEAERYAKDNGFKFIALDNEKSGDIDGSGAVDAKDRMTITRYIAKWKGYESIDKTAADVNSDGEVDAADRMIITRHIAKWKSYETLPYVG